MDLKTPARSIIPALDADVLVALAGITMPLTGRQIARLVETASYGGVNKVLERLRAQGVVDVVEAGRANLYSLNREHVTAPAVEALSDLRGKLFARMSDQVKRWEILPVSVAVFGSAARGDGGVGSDIDILIVRPENLVPNRTDDPRDTHDLGEDTYADIWSSQLFELSRMTRRWSGNQASLIQATKMQLVAMVKRQEPVADSIRSDAIYIWGPNAMKFIEDLV